jgi:phosphotransacetylase
MNLAELVARWDDELAESPARVLFPEAQDERVLKAVRGLAASGSIRPLLVGELGEVASAGAEIVSPGELLADERTRELLEQSFAGHQGAASAGRVGELAGLHSSPLYASVAALAAGRADAVVAGAATASGEVIRAGIRVLGLAEGSRWVTSSFLMVLPDGRVLGFADCAVIPEPEPVQLVQIARDSARTFEVLTGEQARIAFLSFSTMGSARHPRAEAVRVAARMARESLQGTAVDGELQADAALEPSVAATKAPGSTVGGRANVLVFPNLDAGNIAYKLTERLAHARAIGPILQGLAGSLHDLSRGCSVDDVAAMARVAGLLARRRPGVVTEVFRRDDALSPATSVREAHPVGARRGA